MYLSNILLFDKRDGEEYIIRLKSLIIVHWLFRYKTQRLFLAVFIRCCVGIDSVILYTTLYGELEKGVFV